LALCVRWLAAAMARSTAPPRRSLRRESLRGCVAGCSSVSPGAMPLGSSSDAPVISPGPRMLSARDFRGILCFVWFRQSHPSLQILNERQSEKFKDAAAHRMQSLLLTHKAVTRGPFFHFRRFPINAVRKTSRRSSCEAQAQDFRSPRLGHKCPQTFSGTPRGTKAANSRF
jgi:hypothetical protein